MSTSTHNKLVPATVVTIYLGTERDRSGNKIPWCTAKRILCELRLALCSIAGGFTASKCEGGFDDGDGNLMIENAQRIEVILDSNVQARLCAIDLAVMDAARALKQSSVLVTYQSSEGLWKKDLRPDFGTLPVTTS